MIGPLFTFDLEDSSGIYKSSGRFVDNTYKFLDFLDGINVKGTFFVVGQSALAAPALIREIMARGHEVASHSLGHTQLHLQNADLFYKSELEAKTIIEQASGYAVKGFRAPVFSLTPKTIWALDVLQQLGYIYTSSTVPCSNPLNGFPGIPQTPFLWPNGLVEFPCPVVKFGPISTPYLGGIYLRYLPIWLTRRLSKPKEGQVLWTYLHPYDIDASEPYFRMPGTTAVVSILLWMKRGGTFSKLSSVLTEGEKRSFLDLAASGLYRRTLQTS